MASLDLWAGLVVHLMWYSECRDTLWENQKKERREGEGGGGSTDHFILVLIIMTSKF